MKLIYILILGSLLYLYTKTVYAFLDPSLTKHREVNLEAHYLFHLLLENDVMVIHYDDDTDSFTTGYLLAFSHC